MRDTPMAIARNQSGWDTPPPWPCPKQNCCNTATADLRAASPALSARGSTIPAGYAFAIKGRTHGQDFPDRGLDQGIR
jgi:hypothetical protein